MAIFTSARWLLLSNLALSASVTVLILGSSVGEPIEPSSWLGWVVAVAIGVWLIVTPLLCGLGMVRAQYSRSRRAFWIQLTLLTIWAVVAFILLPGAGLANPKVPKVPDPGLR